MLDGEQAVYQYLKEKGVSYEVVSHEPVYTIEDNANDAVERLSYAAEDGRIMGYGIFDAQ